MDIQAGTCCALAGGAGFLASYLAWGRPASVSKRARRLRESDFFERAEAFVEGIGLFKDLERRLVLERRRNECLSQLPEMLDVVTLGLAAGLSFDASLELYCARKKGGLADAMREAMLSWRIGAVPRDEALRDLANQLEVPAFKRFAGAVTQALVFGTPLSETLERQAEAIREEQRSQVAESIEKVPVKMLIPLGTLIVPAMLLAILGPLLGSTLVMG